MNLSKLCVFAAKAAFAIVPFIFFPFVLVAQENDIHSKLTQEFRTDETTGDGVEINVKIDNLAIRSTDPKTNMPTFALANMELKFQVDEVCMSKDASHITNWPSTGVAQVTLNADEEIAFQHLSIFNPNSPNPQLEMIYEGKITVLATFRKPLKGSFESRENEFGKICYPAKVLAQNDYRRKVTVFFKNDSRKKKILTPNMDMEKKTFEDHLIGGKFAGLNLSAETVREKIINAPIFAYDATCGPPPSGSGADRCELINNQQNSGFFDELGKIRWLSLDWIK